MPNYEEPLDAALWFKRIGMIADGALGSVENSLRHAAHLLQMTPEELRPLVGLATDPDSFEALLERGDFDTAARHLVTQPTALSFEGDDGAHLVRATIHCTALNRKVHGIGDSMAKSVLSAWTSCLLQLKAEYGEHLYGLGPQPSAAAAPRRPVTSLADARARRTRTSEDKPPETQQKLT